MRDVLTLVEFTDIDQSSSYIASYPHLVSYLQSLTTITSADVVRASHMVYGWMPTILDLYHGKDIATLDEAADMLEQAKSGHHLTKENLEKLSGLVNNSMVGASKLLHFASPTNYAIWDSRIYFYLYGKKPHHYQVNDPVLYIKYLDALSEISKKNEFEVFHEKINAKLGYVVTAFRAIELVMFQNSRPKKN